MNDLKRILRERDPLYGLADHTIRTSGKSLAATLEEILGLAPVDTMQPRLENS